MLQLYWWWWLVGGRVAAFLFPQNSRGSAASAFALGKQSWSWSHKDSSRGNLIVIPNGPNPDPAVLGIHTWALSPASVSFPWVGAKVRLVAEAAG